MFSSFKLFDITLHIHVLALDPYFAKHGLHDLGIVLENSKLVDYVFSSNSPVGTILLVMKNIISRVY